jgi:hypothetical protein
MTDDNRRALVDLVVVGVASVAAYFVLRDAQRRRTAFRLLKHVTMTAAPRLVWEETTRAWAESAAVAQARHLGPGEQARLKLP